jgi:hypothetical protein
MPSQLSGLSWSLVCVSTRTRHRPDRPVVTELRPLQAQQDANRLPPLITLVIFVANLFVPAFIVPAFTECGHKQFRAAHTAAVHLFRTGACTALLVSRNQQYCDDDVGETD